VNDLREIFGNFGIDGLGGGIESPLIDVGNDDELRLELELLSGNFCRHIDASTWDRVYGWFRRAAENIIEESATKKFYSFLSILQVNNDVAFFAIGLTLHSSRKDGKVFLGGLSYFYQFIRSHSVGIEGNSFVVPRALNNN